MGTITSTLANQSPASDGSLTRVDAKVAFGTSYNNTGSDATTGETLNAKTFGLSQIKSVVFDQLAGSGYGFEILGDNPSGSQSVRVKVYASAGGAGVTGSTSGGTPAGTVTAPTFTGDALAVHTHDNQKDVQVSNTKQIRMYLGTVGGVPAPGDTVTGGTSTETATVSSYVGDASYVVVTGPSGAFTTGEALTFAPSGATATLIGNLVDSWTFAPSLDPNSAVECCGNYTTGVGLLRAPYRISPSATTVALASGSYRYYATISSLETVTADNITQLQIEYTETAVSDDSAGTPSGTNSVPTFAGSALAGHTHTIAAGLSGEVPNATNLAAAGLTAVNVIVYGY